VSDVLCKLAASCSMRLLVRGFYAQTLAQAVADWCVLGCCLYLAEFVCQRPTCDLILVLTQSMLSLVCRLCAGH
jgi:hypothetical protein